MDAEVGHRCLVAAFQPRSDQLVPIEVLRAQRGEIKFISRRRKKHHVRCDHHFTFERREPLARDSVERHLGKIFRSVIPCEKRVADKLRVGLEGNRERPEVQANMIRVLRHDRAIKTVDQIKKCTAVSRPRFRLGAKHEVAEPRRRRERFRRASVNLVVQIPTLGVVGWQSFGGHDPLLASGAGAGRPPACGAP